MIDDMKPQHCGCTYCEKKCIYGEEIERNLRRFNLTDAYDFMQKYKYSVRSVSSAVEQLGGTGIFNIPDRWSRLCMAGFLLSKCDLENGFRKKMLSEYLHNMHMKGIE